MRHTKITPEIRKRCEEIAALKVQIPTYKQLEIETGVHRNYLAKIVHMIVVEHSKENSSTIHVEQSVISIASKVD
jgi:hypothetical protein